MKPYSSSSSPRPRKIRWKRALGLGLAAGLAAASVAGGIAYKREQQRIPRARPVVTAETMSPRVLAERLGGKFHDRLGSDPRRLEELSKQWLDAFDGKPDNVNDHLHRKEIPYFPILPAKILVSVTEAAIGFPSMYRGVPEASPREVMGYVLKARELYQQSARASEDPARFFESRSAAATGIRDKEAAQAIKFFKKLNQADPSVVKEILLAMGLR